MKRAAQKEQQYVMLYAGYYERSEMMNNINIGMLAHVDAGKTTLSESLLYVSGSIRQLGRVDHGNAFLDYDAQEKDRGITIYAKQAIFDWKDTRITLLDTPGHVDFSAEMERVLQVLDYAVVIINALDGIQSHTETIWKLLQHYHVPALVFVNKMDVSHTERTQIMEDLKRHLDEHCVDVTLQDEACQEQLAMCSDELLESYMETGGITDEQLADAVAQRTIFPCCFGSALKMEGIQEFLDMLNSCTKAPAYPEAFGARIFKISRDENGNRLTHMKITGGSLKVKTKLAEDEKVDQIRLYSGTRYQLCEEACSGCVCAVKGLTGFHAGDGLGFERSRQEVQLTSFMNYRVQLPTGCDPFVMLKQLRQLAEEDPQLHVSYDTHLKELHVRLMGDIQTEVLKHTIQERYHTAVDFDEGSVVYKETILNTVEGIGHYEPLRHYAEVHLLLEPLPRGSGLLFESDCKDEVLDRHWQRLILSHLQETEHVGVLSGSPITDMKITLLCGRAHQKHTEGGDFRQATYRALRHGLRSAESILLEPYYEFTLRIPPSCVSRAVFDIERFHGTFTLQEDSGEMSVISGSAPVRKLQSYPQEVYAYTKGKGRLFCTLKGYEACADEEDVLKEVAYDCDADMDHPCGSIFCSHGAGYYVPWNEVKQHMHMQSDWGRMQLKRESYQSYTAKPVDEKELEKIFIRTYGPIKRRPPQKAKPASNIIDLEKQNICYQPLPECLLVDGYNVIHDWEELKAMAKEHLDAARHRLIDIMCSYQGYRGCELILVFDAYKVKAGIGSTHKEGTIHVVYTKQAQTADMYIEQATHQLASEFRVTVATSDGMEQLIASGQGVSRMSSRQLYAEVLRMKNTSVKEFERKQLRGGAEPLKKLREYRIEDADEEMKS